MPRSCTETQRTTEGKINNFGSYLETIVSQGVLRRTELFMESDFPGHNVIKPHTMVSGAGTPC
jgi:hypothetical protein